MSVANNTFSSRLAFILVTAGAAVGLGNVWFFPFAVGQNGGGTYLVLYLIILLLIATPVFVAELLLGRLGKASPPTNLKNLAKESGSRVPWVWVAWIGLISTILILSYYSIIAGQAMAYGFASLKGRWTGMGAESVVAVDTGFKASIAEPAFWHTLFIALTAWVVAKDIRAGIERTAKYLMPILFLLLVGLVLYSTTTSGFGEAVDYLFTFKAVEITPELFISAFGVAFFTIVLGI